LSSSAHIINEHDLTNSSSSSLISFSSNTETTIPVQEYDKALTLYDQPGDGSTPFSSNTDIAVQFQDHDRALTIHTQPGDDSISILLDYVSDRTSSQVSSSNILHPVDGLTDVVINNHSMLTRGKRGILKKKYFLSILTSSDSQSSSTEPTHYKKTLQILVWK
jgi:hypothetical protein